MSGEDLSWIPPVDRAGHELGPGKVSLSWVVCTCRPRSDGHHVAYCRVIGCRAGPALPPGCPGAPDQR